MQKQKIQYDPNDPTHLSKFNRDLPVPLTEGEMQAYGKQLADLIKRDEDLEAKKKQAASEWAAKIKSNNVEINRIATARSNQEEMRPIECIEVLVGSQVFTYRLDTSANVGQRPAETQDLQGTLPHVTNPNVPDVVVDAPTGDALLDDGQGDDGGNDNVIPFEQPADESDDGETPDAPTGTVYDENDNAIGEGIETSAGDSTFVGAPLMCPLCDEEITEHDETAISKGASVHTACLAETDENSDEGEEKPATPEMKASRLATMKEVSEAKKKGRERSAKKNAGAGAGAKKKK